MKKAPIWGLMLKEYYCAKKAFTTFWFMFAVIIIAVLLVMGSFQFGNLKDLDEASKKNILPLLVLYGKYIPMMCLFTIGNGIAENTIQVDKAKVRRFFLITPISGYRIMGAKLLTILLVNGLGLVISLIYGFLLQVLFAIPFSLGTLALMLLVAVGLSFFTFTFMALGFVTKSMDQAGLCMIPILLGVAGLIKLCVGHFVDPAKVAEISVQMNEALLETIAVLENKMIGWIPWLLLLLAVLYLLAFIGLGKLYQRREK